MTLASYILACCFWILAALALVTLMVFVFVEYQYYKWNLEERNTDKRNDSIAKLAEEIKKKMDELS